MLLSPTPTKHFHLQFQALLKMSKKKNKFKKNSKKKMSRYIWCSVDFTSWRNLCSFLPPLVCMNCPLCWGQGWPPGTSRPFPTLLLPLISCVSCMLLSQFIPSLWRNTFCSSFLGKIACEVNFFFLRFCASEISLSCLLDTLARYGIRNQRLFSFRTLQECLHISPIF